MNNAITKKIIVAFVSLLFAVHGLMAQTDTVSFSDLFNMEIEQLMELTIKTASKSSEKITDVPASVLVLTRAEIERLGFQSYSEILEHITGMYFINEYYWLGSKNYGVRGFYSNGQFNNMVILINGVSQLSDKYSDYPDVKINVPVEAIERIEVIRGPMSVIYGSGAFFGAINIITNPENNVYKKMASAGYGSNNTFNSFFRYGSYLTDVKFGVNAGYTRTNDIDVPFTDLTNRTGALEYVGLNQNATTLGQLDDSRKYANINIQYENFYSELSYSETQKDIFDGQPSYGNGSEMSTYATNFIIGFKHTFENELNLRIQGGYYMHSHHLDYTVFNDYYYEIDGQRTNSADIEVQLNGEITDNLYVNIGAQNRTILGLQQISDFGYYGLNYGAGEIGLPRGDMFSNSAIYSQFKYFPSDAVEIVAGLRMEHFGNYTMQYTRGIITEDPADMRDPANPDFRSIIVEEYLPENKGFSFIPRLAILLKPKTAFVF